MLSYLVFIHLFFTLFFMWEIILDNFFKRCVLMRSLFQFDSRILFSSSPMSESWFIFRRMTEFFPINFYMMNYCLFVYVCRASFTNDFFLKQFETLIHCARWNETEMLMNRPLNTHRTDILRQMISMRLMILTEMVKDRPFGLQLRHEIIYSRETIFNSIYRWARISILVAVT